MTAEGKGQYPPLRVRPIRRLVQLYVGLTAYGLSLAVMIRARLGLDPWDVFHQGIAKRTGLTFGTVVIIVGALVLLLWVPLRQRPGIGTVSNVVVVGLAVDAGLAAIGSPHSLPARWALLLAGILANGVATGLYIGARLGPGPRDGLMTGFVARFPRYSIRLVRTGIELSVLAIGFLLGGQIGPNTVLYALAIGPLAHLTIPFFTVRGPTVTGPGDGGEQDADEDRGTAGHVVPGDPLVER